ncbi:hypothetical protein MKW98_005065 [Papaver atlanticum]|uniref:Matrin-type domain-containing protein n=1 Tax=Papaver atlanticum TaxID=357466 RepID=A0AAD4XX53_9MAGN|nr:hypothetical protein MKW98_005065 [Papaver atlanticum]
MSSTLLEVTRSKHEQVERFERLIVKDVQNKPSSNRKRLFQNHRVRNMIKAITSSTEKLIEIYQDNDNARKDEIAALGGSQSTVFSAFYDRLNEIRDYHRCYPNIYDDEESDQDFGEEGRYGRYMDLHELYNEYINSKFAERNEKTKQPIEVSCKLKLTRQYREYLEHLHTPVEQSDKSHFVKDSRNGASRERKQKEIALKESKVKRLCEMLKETIEQTKENVQKKQALTVDEREKEVEEEEDSEEETKSDDDEQQQIYNPLKLPMGCDGKPIPYWLYNLHGLRQEFKCEICGNHSYRGRRDFERHFKEGRHQHGMRCLGIPNTKNFNEITSIQEAKELWERIQARQGVKRWRPDVEEEYEDEDGNIYNKKNFTELQRQGVISVK